MSGPATVEVELVFCSATDLRRPFLEKLQAAAEAGFDGISLTLPDYLAAQAAGLSDRDLTAAIRASGLFIAEISTATRWLDGKSNDEEELGLHLVTRFGGRGLNCTPLNAPYRGIDEAVGAFGAICDRAAQRGARCHIEFVSWTEPRNLETAWEIVRRADRPNGGLMFDTWHHHHSGGTPDDVRAVDPEKIFGVQLSDAPADAPRPDGFSPTSHRLLPGQGAADVVGSIRALEDIGVGVPYGGEVPSPEWHDRPASYCATALHAALVDVVTRARRDTNRD